MRKKLKDEFQQGPIILIRLLKKLEVINNIDSNTVGKKIKCISIRWGELYLAEKGMWAS